jgi:hypothetical protein
VEPVAAVVVEIAAVETPTASDLFLRQRICFGTRVSRNNA